jgi:hypothetical protein
MLSQYDACQNRIEDTYEEDHKSEERGRTRLQGKEPSYPGGYSILPHSQGGTLECPSSHAGTILQSCL